MIDFAEESGDVVFARAETVAKRLLAVADERLSDERTEFAPRSAAAGVGATYRSEPGEEGGSR